jgi:signal transduction histidine kinase
MKSRKASPVRTSSKSPQEKPTKRALSKSARTARSASSSKKPDNLGLKKEAATPLPRWLLEQIFPQARIIGWEGTVGPLTASFIYPADASLLRSLPSVASSRWYRCIHPLDSARVQLHFSKIQDQHLPCYIDYRLIDKNGSIVWVRHSTTEVSGQNGSPIVRGFVADIQTEKGYQLESLRVCEREQNRIGQDLHDDLCQVLAGVSCLMRVAESRIITKAPEEADNFKELNQQIIDAMHRTRALTHGLFPGKIQIADIRGALLELSTQLKARFPVEIVTQFIGRFPKHSSAQIIQIYRIAQESITNAIKHGTASKVVVKLEAFADRMELSITDNGTGLGKADTSTGGIGLHIMHYRAGILGGEISIANNKTGGVTACLRYPFQN